METAKEIAKIHKLKVIPDKRLREFDGGDLIDMPNRWEYWDNYRKEKSRSLGIKSWEVKSPGGESEIDHFNRVKSFFQEIKVGQLKVPVDRFRVCVDSLLRF